MPTNLHIVSRKPKGYGEKHGKVSDTNIQNETLWKLKSFFDENTPEEL